MHDHRTLCLPIAALAGVVTLLASLSANAQETPLSGAEEKLVAELTTKLAEGTEGRAMLDAILEGRRMGPGEGWFALAKARSRFDWNDTRERYDRDGDGDVTRREFPGSDDDFARLDRDGSRSLGEADFDFSTHARVRTPGFLLYEMADADVNGQVTREEFAALFDRFDTDAAGYLALDDLRDRFTTPAEPRETSRRPGAGPSREMLLRGLLAQEIGAHAAGPAVGERAPDFELTSVDGKPYRLSDHIGERPVALVFGNFTCSPFRGAGGNVEKLYKRYADRAEFAFVYVREAHPSDGWSLPSNERVEVSLPQPRTFDERHDVANLCRKHLDLSLPFLVDGIDDPVGGTYSGMPSRLYLIDTDGKVAYKSGRGPFGFQPRELEHSLLLMLADLDAEKK